MAEPMICSIELTREVRDETIDVHILLNYDIRMTSDTINNNFAFRERCDVGRTHIITLQ